MALEHRHRHHLGILAQGHAAHADAGAALGLARIGGGEADRLACVGREEYFLACGQQLHADQPVAAVLDEAHGVFAVGGDVGESIHRIAPHHPLLGGEYDAERAPLAFVLGQREDVGDAFLVAQRQQVDHRAPLRLRPALWQLPHLEAIDASGIREEKHGVVGRSDEQFDDRVFVLGGHSGATLAAARLRPEGRERGALDIAVVGDGHDHLVALDQVLVLEPVPGRSDLGDARSRVEIADLLQFLAQHAVELDPVGEDREIFLDRIRQHL